VNLPQLGPIEVAHRSRIDCAAVDADERGNHRGVLLGQVEPVGREVEEAGLDPCANGVLLSGIELREAQQSQREQLAETGVELVGDDQHWARLARHQERELGVGAAAGGGDQLVGPRYFDRHVA
jgi:hypothetical protein